MRITSVVCAFALVLAAMATGCSPRDSSGSAGKSAGGGAATTPSPPASAASN